VTNEIGNYYKLSVDKDLQEESMIDSQAGVSVEVLT